MLALSHLDYPPVPQVSGLRLSLLRWIRQLPLGCAEPSAAALGSSSPRSWCSPSGSGWELLLLCPCALAGL